LDTAKKEGLSDPFAREMEKVRNKVSRDQRRIIEAIFGTEESEEIPNTYDVWEKLDQRKRYAIDFGIFSPKREDFEPTEWERLKKKYSKVFGNLYALQREVVEKDFFLEAVDLMALWEIKNAKPGDQILLLAGLVHLKNIEKSLKTIGFKKVLSTPSFFERLVGDPIPDEPDHIVVPEGLDAAIKLGVLFMSEHAGCGSQ
jgi:hypothetical protein